MATKDARKRRPLTHSLRLDDLARHSDDPYVGPAVAAAHASPFDDVERRLRQALAGAPDWEAVAREAHAREERRIRR